MKFRMLLVIFMAVAIVGCSPRMKRLETTTINNKQRLAENDIRLHNLEASLAHVQSRVSDLDHRNYEVRTRNGKKTGMVAVPVATPKPAPIAAISSRDNLSTTDKKPVPAGRKIDPQAPATPIAKSPAVKGSSSEAPTQPTVNQKAKNTPEAGPSGRLVAQSLRPDELALPPAEMPPAENAASISHAAGHDAPVTPKVVEDALGMPPVALPVVEQNQRPAPSVPTAVEPARTATSSGQSLKGEESAYKEALNLARSGRSADGIARFEAFLQSYPSGKYAPNAFFWIGECLYSQGKYQDALNQYQKVNDSYTNHHKNADALLKAGMSMKRLGNNEGANQKFQELKRLFPGSEAAKRIR